MSVEEDYFIPVRGGVSTKIENLPGGAFTGDIDDVKYLRDKLFAALKIPQSYLIRGEAGEEDKGALAQKDIRFARTVQRLQRSVITELEKIGIIHLFTLGFRGEDLIKFSLRLNNPSKISELQELETWRTKFDVAAAATDGFFSKRWIAHNLFDISDEEFLRNQRELFYDKKVTFQLEALAEDGAADQGAAGSPFGGGGGGDLGDLGDTGDAPLDLGGEDLGGPEADTPEEAPAGEEDPVLLATPDEPAGKRDDGPTVFMDKHGNTTTRKSKGKKHTPTKDDKRRSTGPRNRQMKALSRHEMAKMPSRQVRMNLPAGAKEMLGLGKGIFENKTTNYEKEEKKIFEVKEEIKKIFEDLEQI
tara:strand:- start:10707 stop:11786 length:1080 start_codon:yes stop_codon:yes gene_type:complete